MIYAVQPENRTTLVEIGDVEMLPPVFVKTPSERLQYIWDWSRWLADGDDIQENTVTLPNGLTSHGTSASDTQVLTVISGGTVQDDGTYYTVTCSITTKLGLIAERSINIKVVATR
jgi:hypothetical protein